MPELYVEVQNISEDKIYCCTQSALTIFIYSYLTKRKCSNNVQLLLVLQNKADPNYREEIYIKHQELIRFTKVEKVFCKEEAKYCKLPVLVHGQYSTAGLCSVVRKLVDLSGLTELLGHKKGCLKMCAETSPWTKFCEIDLIETVEKLMTDLRDEKLTTIFVPTDLIRFEAHLRSPVRGHNIYKTNRNFSKERGLSEKTMNLTHIYAEGVDMLLTDIMILPSVHLLFSMIPKSIVENKIPTVASWYDLTSQSDNIRECLPTLLIEKTRVAKEWFTTCKDDNTPAKHFNSRTKAGIRFTRQGNIEQALKVLDGIDLSKISDQTRRNFTPLRLNWESVPYYAHPKGGKLPDNRGASKIHQIENLAGAVCELAKDGDVIVDFCCGCGHLGIVIAYLLPKCSIILLDNKSQSLEYAMYRVNELKLENISCVQTNIDYFESDFDLGVSLHACGVATDLVINLCVKKDASFVVSPCCYGKLQENHVLKYPRSRAFAKSDLTQMNYYTVGHCADQTHRQLYEKSEQGENCMKAIDSDRCLYAIDNGFGAYLMKFDPPSCTPKNNFIVGVKNLGEAIKRA